MISRNSMIALYKLLDLLGFHFFSSRKFRYISGAASLAQEVTHSCLLHALRDNATARFLRRCGDNANYSRPLRFIPLISTGFGWCTKCFSRCFWMISSIHFYMHFYFICSYFSIFFQSFLMFSHWSAVWSAPPRPRKWLSGLRPWMTSSPMPEALASLIVLVA